MSRYQPRLPFLESRVQSRLEELTAVCKCLALLKDINKSKRKHEEGMHRLLPASELIIELQQPRRTKVIV